MITRALGAEPDVEVDSEAFPARAGDLFLLCSDGLTAWSTSRPQADARDRSRSLEQTGRALIAAANKAGGRDNITVILFRLEEVEDRRGQAPAAATLEGDATAEYDTFAGESVPREGVSKPNTPWWTTRRRPSTGATARWPCRRSSRRAVQRPRPASHRSGPSRCRTRRAAPAAAQAPHRHAPAARGGRRPGARRRLARHRRGLLRRHGRGPAHSVTIYRGLPYGLPFGIDLYQTYYESGVPLASVPPARRARFTDHQLRSRDDAEDLVIQLERGQVE